MFIFYTHERTNNAIIFSETNSIYTFMRGCDEFNNKEEGCTSENGLETCTIVCDSDNCNSDSFDVSTKTTGSTQPSTSGEYGAVQPIVWIV